MAHTKLLRNKTGRFLGLSLLIAIAFVLLFSGSTKTEDGRMATGYAQLTSVQRFSEIEGAMCPVVPASAAQSLVAALSQQRAGSAPMAAKAAADARPSEAARLENSKRPPVRLLRDPSSAFSAVAIDLKNNEVVMADENNFAIMTYDRMENTPPRAKMSEPKRIIQGIDAYLEFNCAVYVDPNNGDIYSVNNDTLNWMTVFNRNVKGNMPPTRKLRAPHTVFGIAVDEEKQEILLAEQDDHAVVVFKKTAKDHDSPVRVLQGKRTLMADPHGIALDPKSGLIYVTNWGTNSDRPPLGDASVKNPRFGGVARTLWPVERNYNVPGSGRIMAPSITVYPKDASGDTPPLRVIEGPKTEMNWPTAIAIDPDHGEMFVANDTADSITVYRTDANGDVAPIRVLKGPKSLIKNPTGVAYDTKHEELWVANFGHHAASVFKRTASGDEAPLRVIRSAPLEDPAPMMGNPHTIAYDTKREEILVSNCVAHPQVAAFSRLAVGGARATRSIAGQNTLITRTIHDMAYDPVRDEIVIPQFFAFAILTYKGDANGDVAPIRKIFGPHTQLKNSQRLAIDPVHGEIFVPQGNSILVFPRDADGDVAPIRVIKGPDTQLGVSAVTVDPVHNLLIASGSRPRGEGERGGGGEDDDEGGGGIGRGHILIFNRTDNGNVKPRAVISGPMADGATLMTTYPPKGLIIAAVHRGGRASDLGYVGVWSINDNGPVPPLWTIGGPKGLLKDTRGVAIDPKHKSVIVSDKYVNGIATYYFPEIF